MEETVNQTALFGPLFVMLGLTSVVWWMAGRAALAHFSG